MRAWLDANPDDELAGLMREEATHGPLRYVTYEREYLGWGLFALRRRRPAAAKPAAQAGGSTSSA